MTEREDELAWCERVLDEKEHELNRIEDTLAEKQLWRYQKQGLLLLSRV